MRLEGGRAGDSGPSGQQGRLCGMAALQQGSRPQPQSRSWPLGEGGGAGVARPGPWGSSSCLLLLSPTLCLDSWDGRDLLGSCHTSQPMRWMEGPRAQIP